METDKNNADVKVDSVTGNPLPFSETHTSNTIIEAEEIALLQSLHHPNIIAVREVLEGVLFVAVVLELANGGDLRNYINYKWKGHLNSKEGRRIFSEIALGVHYLHSNFIAHRDLKPENILLQGENLQVKISDFGLSKQVAESGPLSFMFETCGTPVYSAPEVLSRKYTLRVDNWSVGAILYVMMIGSMPFEGNPFTQDVVGEYCRIKEYGPLYFPHSTSRELVNICSRLLEFDPEKRLSLSAALEHPWLSGFQFDINSNSNWTTSSSRNNHVLDSTDIQKYYDSASASCEKLLLDSSNNPPKWRPSDHKYAGVQLFTATPPVGQAVLCCMGKSCFEYPSEMVTEVFQHGSMGSLSPWSRESKILEDFGNGCSVLYSSHETARYLHKIARDFVVVRMISREVIESTHRTVIACVSCNHPAAPKRSGYVRADILLSGWIILPLSPKSCIVTYMLQVDLKGNVDPRTISKMQICPIQFMDALRTHLSEKASRINSRPKSWLRKKSAGAADVVEKIAKKMTKFPHKLALSIPHVHTVPPSIDYEVIDDSVRNCVSGLPKLSVSLPAPDYI